jgi:hypothetical protein
VSIERAVPEGAFFDDLSLFYLGFDSRPHFWRKIDISDENVLQYHDVGTIDTV